MSRLFNPLTKRFLSQKISQGSSLSSSIDLNEIQQFAKVAREWWNPYGPYELLHRMNPIRVSYIRSLIEQNHQVDAGYPFKGFKMLDIGCGGGFLSEV